MLSKRSIYIYQERPKSIYIKSISESREAESREQRERQRDREHQRDKENPTAVPTARLLMSSPPYMCASSKGGTCTHAQQQPTYDERREIYSYSLVLSEFSKSSIRYSR
jgi:hypothetical protein